MTSDENGQVSTEPTMTMDPPTESDAPCAQCKKTNLLSAALLVAAAVAIIILLRGSRPTPAQDETATSGDG